MTLADLSPEYRTAIATPRPSAPLTPLPATTFGRLEDCEAHRQLSTIAAACGNLTQVARTLGIAKSTLYLKLKKFGIERPE